MKWIYSSTRKSHQEVTSKDGSRAMSFFGVCIIIRSSRIIVRRFSFICFFCEHYLMVIIRMKDVSHAYEMVKAFHDRVSMICSTILLTYNFSTWIKDNTLYLDFLFFYVLPTVHLCIILVINQLNAQILAL
jgi:hypothetical protein